MDSAMYYASRLVDCLNRIDYESFDRAISLIRTSWIKGRKIFCCGNGGSALTAQHYITDWNKGCYLARHRPFYGYCLADNVGLFSAYANDVNYEDVFVAQLRPLLMPGDLVIGISGSGNSKNVLNAIKYANDHEAFSLGICGYDGGGVKSLAQHTVWVPIDDMQVSEDIHLVFGHMVMRQLCESMGADQSSTGLSCLRNETMQE